jgi:hypothetical protein
VDGRQLHGDRPEAPPGLVAAERELAQAAEDARVAKTALVAAEGAAGQHAELVRDLGARRSDLLRQAIVEIVSTYARGPLMQAYRTAQAAELVIANIEGALAESGDLQGAAGVRHAAHLARAACEPPPVDAAQGRAFVDRLAADPTAELAA